MRSVPRSIARLVKKGYLVRSGDSKRYLYINFTPFQEELVSHSEHDPVVTPPMTLRSPPHDPAVIQLDQRSIVSNNIHSANEVTFQGIQDKLKALDIHLPITTLARLTTKHGLEYVDSKIDVTMAQENLDNRAKFFMAAVRDDYRVKTAPKADTVVPSASDIIFHNRNTKPHLEALRALQAINLFEPEGKLGKNYPGDAKYYALVNDFEYKLADQIIKMGGRVPEAS